MKMYITQCKFCLDIIIIFGVFPPLSTAQLYDKLPVVSWVYTPKLIGVILILVIYYYSIFDILNWLLFFYIFSFLLKNFFFKF